MSYVVGVKTNRKILFFQNVLASETEIQIARTAYHNENFFMKIYFPVPLEPMQSLVMLIHLSYKCYLRIDGSNSLKFSDFLTL